MRESLILTDEDEDEKAEQAKTSAKRSESTAKIGASILEKGSTPPVEQPKMNSLDKLLASLLPEKEAKTEQNAKAKGILAELAKSKQEVVEELEPSRELSPDELSGGEVIIDLRAEDVDEEAAGELSVNLQAPSENTPEDSVHEPDDPTQPATTTAHRPIPASAGGGNGGKTPPPKKSAASSPPPPRPSSNTTHMPWPRAVSPPVPSANFNAAPAGAPGSTFNQILTQQRELEQASYYGRRHGRVEGLLGGIIIGGFFENLRNRSRERRLEKQMKQQHQKQEKRMNDLEFQQNLLKSEQLEQARRDQAERYERKAAAKQEMAIVAQAQMSEAEAIKHAREVTRTAQEQERDKAALIERLNAQAARQEQLEAEQRLQNPENHIMESAWHSIEVDKAGHAVQETNIEYGHEYYQERGHESGPKDVITRDSVTGAAALTAATIAGSAQNQTSGQAAPSMLGMPAQSAGTLPDTTYDDQDSSGADNTPGTSPTGVLFLFSVLVVVVILIIVLT